MRNCLILGSGRSGTSMVAGILHQANYFMGDRLYRPAESNPRGFFEWMEITQINEAILANYGDCRSFPALLSKMIFKKHTVRNPGQNQRWLLSLPPQVRVTNLDTTTKERIERVVRQEPFCYKDPRFSYTLPVWKRFLSTDTVFICVFREVNVTVESILKECRTREYLRNFKINRRDTYRVWGAIYRHILGHWAHQQERFFFVHYRQIYDGSGLPGLADFLGADLRGDFVDPHLKRTVSTAMVPESEQKIYDRLCQLAGF
jgi:hypothetical protein